MARILITSRSFGSGDGSPIQDLEQQGHEILRGPATHDLEQLLEILPSVDAWIAGTGPVTRAHLEHASRLRVLARYGVGVEAIDLPAADDHEVVVTNTPGANSDAVADHALALMLAALRSVTTGDRRVRAGSWKALRGRQLGSFRVAIIGFGRIGRGVARRLSGFGSDVLAVDPLLSVEEIIAAGARPISLDDSAREADVVSLHAPGGRAVIDADWLGRLARPLVLVNTARADLIDEAALARALREDRVAAVSVDTLAGDIAADDSPLLDPDLADRVTVTPHLGAQTVEAVDAMGDGAVRAVLDVLAGRDPQHRVGAQPGPPPPYEESA